MAGLLGEEWKNPSLHQCGSRETKTELTLRCVAEACQRWKNSTLSISSVTPASLRWDYEIAVFPVDPNVAGWSTLDRPRGHNRVDACLEF